MSEEQQEIYVDYEVRVTWLAMARMYTPIAIDNDMTVTMAFALVNINLEFGSKATKIAPLLGMEPRSLTRLLKKMESDEIIVRRPDEKDGRAVRIYLTDKGLEMRKYAKKAVDDFNNMLIEKIGLEKLNELAITLAQIRKHTEQFKSVYITNR